MLHMLCKCKVNNYVKDKNYALMNHFIGVIKAKCKYLERKAVKKRAVLSSVSIITSSKNF